MIFIGTGEHLPEFEVFDVKPFVSRLLGKLIHLLLFITCDSSFEFTVYLTMYLAGMGDLPGLIDKIQDVIPADQQPEFLAKLSEGTFTLRLLYEQFQNLLKMGSLGQVNYLLQHILQYVCIRLYWYGRLY